MKNNISDYKQITETIPITSRLQERSRQITGTIPLFHLVTGNEFYPNLASEFRGDWWVAPPHAIELRRYRPITPVGVQKMKPVVAEMLVGRGKEKDVLKYHPGEDAAELLTGLLDVAQERRRPTDFADRFGLMGYNKWREPMDTDWTFVSTFQQGEPLMWLLAHARTLFVLSQLMDLVNRARRTNTGRERLADYLQNMPDDVFAAGPYLHCIPKEFRRENRGSIEAANVLIRWLLNPNLVNVSREVVVHGAELQSVFVFRAPIQASYWHLAGQFGKVTLRKCRACHRVFMHDRKVKFCLPTRGQTISPCKSRFNVSLFRKRRRRLWVKRSTR